MTFHFYSDFTEVPQKHFLENFHTYLTKWEEIVPEELFFHLHAAGFHSNSSTSSCEVNVFPHGSKKKSMQT